MKLLLARGLLRIWAWIPLPLLRLGSVATGRLLAALPGKRARRVDDHLARAFPDRPDRWRRRVARDNAVEMTATLVECGGLWYRSPRWIESRILNFDGKELLDADPDDGRGLLLVGGHLGQWELPLLAISRRVPVTFLYKRPSSEAADRLLTARRSRFGATMAPADAGGMRMLLKTLRGGGTAGMLVDQLPKGGEFVEVPFFGLPVATTILPWRLARRTGCRVAVGHALRLPRGRGWTIIIEELPDLGRHEEPLEACARMNAALERMVRAAPEQYLWHYRRFDPAR
ncbi:MAG: lipid A biosynthesis acyltransferase [Wenzhouxiangellaceae bacterium]|nr:lipid A biosynthesis acyltransferase [Wenzhouxiangellaceae bacterium]